jgi:uncharacterized protein involved in response to NO
MNKQQIFQYPLFALGFRAFFLLSGFSALLFISLWRSIYDGSLSINNYYTAINWHMHEMLLGYTTAVISGFLLTAVRNWTGQNTLTGDALAGLCLLWLAGRIMPFYAGYFPDGLIALVDFAFLPALAYQLSKPILQAEHYKSFIFVGLLLLITLGNGLIHAENLDLLKNSAWLGTKIIVATIIMLILVIAGRIFPFFTERGIPGTICLRNPLLDLLSIASATLFFVLEIFDVSGGWLAIAAIAAAIFNSMRVSGWYVRSIWYVPLLWVLYVGYGWIILGFLLTIFSAFGLIIPSLAIHAFTVGGIGGLTLGMMARVSLGHTGRALKASNAIAISFVLINLAVLFRVLMPIAMPDWYAKLLVISTELWLMAFALFMYIYLPILTQPRSDGKPD